MTELGPKSDRPLRARHITQYFQAGRPLTMLTAYDAMIVRVIDVAGVDMILVGDSHGTTMLGVDSTVGVTLDGMVRAMGAVTRGTKRALVVEDLSFGTYEPSRAQVVGSVAALVRAGTAAAKLKRGRRMAVQAGTIVDAGINVMGHLGLTPQSENQLGGKRMQGRGDATHEILEDAPALQGAGALVIVFEMVPASTTTTAAKKLNIPIVGVGAGPAVAGRVLVWCDMVGVQGRKPSFAHQFGNVGVELSRATLAYHDAVVNRTFPATENFHQD